MKKIFFILLFLFLCFNFSFGKDISFSIKNKYEYINITGDNVSVLKPYYSNKGNKYFFIGAFDFFEVPSEKILNFLEEKGEITQDSLFLSGLNGTYALLDKQESINISQCKKLDKKTKFLFDKFQSSGVLRAKKERIIGSIKESKSNCYYKDSSKMIFAIGEIPISDLEYIYNNSEKLYSFAMSLKQKFGNLSKKTIIKKAYKYILQKVDYNFSFIENLQKNTDFEKTPWKISSFFEGKKVVCDNYVKVFIFLLGFFDIDSERIEGKIQPLDDSIFGRDNFLHSWVKIGDKYFDPTFDDTGNNTGDNSLYRYFGKSKKCFVLEHKFPEGEKFDNKQERISYVKKNFVYFANNCPFILTKVSIKDENLFYVIKKFLERFDLEKLKSIFCDSLNLCIEKKIDDKQDFLEEIKKYKLVINKKEYSFGKELDGFKFSKNLKYLNENQIVKTEQICDKIFEILNKKYYNERFEKFKNIKSLVQNFLRREDVSENRKSIVKYFDKLFVVEKLK